MLCRCFVWSSLCKTVARGGGTDDAPFSPFSSSPRSSLCSKEGSLLVVVSIVVSVDVAGGGRRGEASSVGLVG